MPVHNYSLLHRLVHAVCMSEPTMQVIGYLKAIVEVELIK